MKIWLCVVCVVAAQDSMFSLDDGYWGKRNILTHFSLGPAPFPHPHQMDYEIFGDAYLQHDSIKVTDAVQNQKGAIWSKEPMPFHHNWQADLTFRMGGQAGDFFGDGFAFWFSNERGVGGNALGGPNIWKGVAVFFDTFKNDAFRGKEHPYVYGISNDGGFDYNKLSHEDVQNGCHVPLRGSNPDELENTVARITYKDGTLSVVMQPRGAVDWVKCFEMESNDADRGFYFGITAMTGDLVDKHHMVDLKVYTDVEIQPFTYSEPNEDISTMWEEMKHSGDIARNFEKWEQEILDETTFDIYDQEEDWEKTPYGDYDDEDDEEENGDDHTDVRAGGDPVVVNMKKYQKIQERRSAYEAKSKKDGDFEFTLGEIGVLGKVLDGTSIGKQLEESLASNKAMMNKLREHIEGEVNEVAIDLTKMVREIRDREHRINSRISKLAAKLHIKLSAHQMTVSQGSRSWVWPFLVLFSILVSVAAVGYRRYHGFMKTHLL